MATIGEPADLRVVLRLLGEKLESVVDVVVAACTQLGPQPPTPPEPNVDVTMSVAPPRLPRPGPIEPSVPDRFESPATPVIGDRIKIIINCAPDGRNIVDTLVTDSSGITASMVANRIRAQAHKRVWRLIGDIGKMRTRLHRLGAFVDRDLRDDEVPEALANAERDLLIPGRSLDQLEMSVSPMHRTLPRRRR